MISAGISSLACMLSMEASLAREGISISLSLFSSEGCETSVYQVAYSRHLRKEQLARTGVFNHAGLSLFRDFHKCRLIPQQSLYGVHSGCSPNRFQQTDGSRTILGFSNYDSLRAVSLYPYYTFADRVPQTQDL